MEGKTSSSPERGELLHEGKAKRVYSTSQPDLYIQEFKDSATAFDGSKKGTIGGKGSVNCLVSAKLFKLLESRGVKTHFVDLISDNEMVILPVEIIMVEVILRNVAAGSLVRNLGFEEGKPLVPPICEFHIKDDAIHDPLIADDHVIALGLATAEELGILREYGKKINETLIEFFDGIGIDLIDFKVEFGRRPDGTIILADEISPDSCRFWDKETGKKLDKDRFRFDLGDVEEAYQEILERTGASM